MATFVFDDAQDDTASFEELGAVYDHSKPVDSFLRDSYFGYNILLNGKDEVPVGEIKTYVPLAPAVLPTAQGRVIRDKVQLNVSYIKAPYLKPACVVEPLSDIDA